MSAKELKFSEDGLTWFRMTISDTNQFHVNVTGSVFDLDRDEAYLLMLYLQEHLNENVLHSRMNKLGYWLCNCGKWHPKDFVCERISK